ncbi:hypothetical protein VKT23_015233 [Stygiomarasmius scandens]|uniref:Uncharacterized protein n=1 Tax=Marasmiellus scandens TaxID=2682957 RepID=A0ABR1IYM4_9AGAR
MLLTFQQVGMAVAGLQRMFLELLALLDYCEIFKPRMLGQSPPSHSPAPVIGAFTWNIDSAGMLFAAGIPFWFVHRVSAVPNVSVMKLAPLLATDTVCSEESPFTTPVIFQGVANVEAQYKAIAEYTTSAFTTYSPFESVRSRSLEIASSTNLVMRNQRTDHRNLKPYNTQNKSQQNQGRWTFPKNSLYPAFSAAWAWALERVDRSQPPVYSNGGGYAFPDPQLIISVTKREKMSTYCKNYIKFRSLLKYRLLQESPTLVSNQIWRQLLVGDFGS